MLHKVTVAKPLHGIGRRIAAFLAWYYRARVRCEGLVMVINYYSFSIRRKPRSEGYLRYRTLSWCYPYCSCLTVLNICSKPKSISQELNETCASVIVRRQFVDAASVQNIEDSEFCKLSRNRTKFPLEVSNNDLLLARSILNCCRFRPTVTRYQTDEVTIIMSAVVVGSEWKIV